MYLEQETLVCLGFASQGFLRGSNDRTSEKNMEEREGEEKRSSPPLSPPLLLNIQTLLDLQAEPCRSRHLHGPSPAKLGTKQGELY